MRKLKRAKRIISILLAFIMSVSLLSVTTTTVQAAVAADYGWYGDGKASTFTIGTPAELLGLANIVNGTDGKSSNTFENKTVTLTADIDLSSVCGTAIGSWSSIGCDVRHVFDGTFDGDGHKVVNLYINDTSDYQGLFGRNTGTIKNLGVSGSIVAANYAGGISAYCSAGIIQNCYNECTIQGAMVVGGITGGASAASISKCYNMGNVSASEYGGGVVGFGENTAVSNSYNMGAITGTVGQIGGIVGGGLAATIRRCYNTGNVSGAKEVGGIVGKNAKYGENASAISDCVSLGETITCSQSVGRIIGDNTAESELSGNKARSDMSVMVNSIAVANLDNKSANQINGEDVSTTGAALLSAVFNGWPSDLWQFTGTDQLKPGVVLPTLKSILAAQTPKLPGVDEPDPETSTVTSVKITPTSATVIQGKTKTFAARVDGTGQPSQSVTWSVSGKKSSKTKISTTGKLTVGSDEKATTLTVKAVSKADKTKSATVKVKVAAKLNTKFTSGNFTYMITDEKTTGSGTVTLTGIGIGKSVTSLTVPATVNCRSISYKVTAVGDKAFDQNKRLRKAVIGNNVTKIGKNAFRDCTSLAEVTVGNKVTKILSGAFLRCKSLNKITIGTGLKEIGAHAFCLDKALRTMTIKSTKLTKVGEHSMNATNNLKIKVPATKVSAYKKLFANKLQGVNVKVIKK